MDSAGHLPLSLVCVNRRPMFRRADWMRRRCRRRRPRRGPRPPAARSHRMGGYRASRPPGTRAACWRCEPAPTLGRAPRGPLLGGLQGSRSGPPALLDRRESRGEQESASADAPRAEGRRGRCARRQRYGARIRYRSRAIVDLQCGTARAAKARAHESSAALLPLGL